MSSNYSSDQISATIELDTNSNNQFEVISSDPITVVRVYIGE